MLDLSAGLLLISAQHDDPVIEEIRRNFGSTWLLTNLCQAQVTVDIGGSRACDRVILQGRSFEPNRLGGILVAGMACVAPVEYTCRDARYIEEETLATWTALLRKVNCRVLNRPSFDGPPLNLPSVLTRIIAREAGIPTINDDVCCG